MIESSTDRNEAACVKLKITANVPINNDLEGLVLSLRVMFCAQGRDDSRWEDKISQTKERNSF